MSGVWSSHLMFVYLSISFLPPPRRRAAPIAPIASFSIKMFKIIVFVGCLVCLAESVLYSSFWAPLFDPKILNYRVDVKFDPDSGVNARELYEKKYGHQGELLIADLGNGQGLRDSNQDYQVSKL